MKLYSRGQVARRISYGVIVAFILTALIFFNLGKKQAQKNNSAESNSSQEQVQNVRFDESEVVTYDSGSSAGEVGLPVANNQVTYTQDENENINVYRNCNEAVVNINTKVTSYDWFWDPYVTDGGSGSGSIIDKRGYILTNVHVISGATKIYVSLYDGSQYEATVVGTDIDSDLAVIKFDPPQGLSLKTISFGDSTSLLVGQKVIAIGNPFGMERTMTTGIVSGLGRPIQNSNNRIIRNMIQTDAAINPGNSGGPLLDTNGRMVGINTMIMSSSGSSSGVGFAVPSEIAVRVVNDLLKYGKVQRGVIDATIVQLTNRIAQYAGLDIATGMLVSEVEEGSNAEKAGLKGGTKAVYYGSRNTILYLGGDVITKIDGIAITSLAEYYSALESKKPGDVVSVVVRRNKKDVTLKITLAE